MLIMTKATYPASEVKRAIETFTSPDFPKRPDCAREIGSFVYNDYEGTHTVFLLDVEDARLAEYFAVQTQRAAYFTARVSGARTSVTPGYSVTEGMQLVWKEMP